MSQSLNLVDRVRIEWAVWSLDQRLYDLPRRSRVAKRRELRANVLSAAQDVGTSEALHRLGDSRQLADEYLIAELGAAPRASWWAAVIFISAFPLLFMSISAEIALAFGDGITAVDPNVTGTFTRDGMAHLQSEITYTFDNGQGDYVGGAMTPLCWLLAIVVTILVGRLWRTPLAWWRRRSAAAAHIAS